MSNDPTLINRLESEIAIIERTMGSISSPEMRAYWENRLRYLTDELNKVKSGLFQNGTNHPKSE